MGKVILEEQTGASTPASNKVAIYPKAGGGIYKKADDGVESLLATNQYIDTRLFGTVKAGRETLVSGTTSVTVSYGSYFNDTNYKIIATLQNTVDVSPAVYDTIITDVTTSGFTATFATAIDSVNYELNYYNTTASGVADQGGIDHGTLDGLADDDHPLYATNAEVTAADAVVTAAYTVADTTISGDLVTAYTAADAVVTAAYTVADTTISGDLVTGYTAADATVSGDINTAYVAADVVVTSAFGSADAVVTSAYTSADTTISGDLVTAFTAAATTISGDLVTGYTAADAVVTAAYTVADTTISGDLVTGYTAADAVVTAAYTAADTTISGDIVAQLHTRSHAITSTADHTGGNWKVAYSNGAGEWVELPLGASGTALTSQGAGVAPIFV